MDVYLYSPDLSRMPGLTEIPDISSNRKHTESGSSPETLELLFRQFIFRVAIIIIN